MIRSWLWILNMNTFPVSLITNSILGLQTLLRLNVLVQQNKPWHLMLSTGGRARMQMSILFNNIFRSCMSRILSNIIIYHGFHKRGQTELNYLDTHYDWLWFTRAHFDVMNTYHGAHTQGHRVSVQCRVSRCEMEHGIRFNRITIKPNWSLC